MLIESSSVMQSPRPAAAVEWRSYRIVRNRSFWLEEWFCHPRKWTILTTQKVLHQAARVRSRTIVDLVRERTLLYCRSLAPRVRCQIGECLVFHSDRSTDGRISLHRA